MLFISDLHILFYILVVFVWYQQTINKKNKQLINKKKEYHTSFFAVFLCVTCSWTINSPLVNFINAHKTNIIACLCFSSIIISVIICFKQPNKTLIKCSISFKLIATIIHSTTKQFVRLDSFINFLSLNNFP
jgi:hypothetical protein